MFIRQALNGEYVACAVRKLGCMTHIKAVKLRKERVQPPNNCNQLDA